MRRNHRSVFSLISNDASINLLPPLPPSPPSFLIALESERDQDQDRTPIEDTVPYRTETIVDDPFNRKAIANLNSGRRIKVLERFGAIWKCNNRNLRHRESGGADDSEDSRRTLRSGFTKRRSRARLSSTDIYDRFRGSLQHTLARREAVRARKEFKNAVRGTAVENLNIRRSNVVARLKYKNVPPSYRLLANIQVEKRTELQIPQPVPPPLPPPPPPPPNPWTRGTKLLPQERRQCRICNRPVQQSPSSSVGSLVESRQDIRLFRNPPIRRAREDYAIRDRPAFVSKPLRHR